MDADQDVDGTPGSPGRVVGGDGDEAEGAADVGRPGWRGAQLTGEDWDHPALIVDQRDPVGPECLVAGLEPARLQAQPALGLGEGGGHQGATPNGGGVKWRPVLNGGLFGGAEMAAGRNGGAKWRREKDELAAGEMAAPKWRRRNGGVPKWRRKRALVGQLVF